VFEVGDYVYLRVSPIRGLRRFKIRGKLSHRFIGPFKILERKGEVAYQLELPAQLSDVHDVFHVSQLKKCSSEIKVVLTQNVHLAPSTQQAEQDGFTRAKNHETCHQFSLKMNKRQGS
jgi:hypothetical protein